MLICAWIKLLVSNHIGAFWFSESHNEWCLYNVGWLHLANRHFFLSIPDTSLSWCLERRQNIKCNFTWAGLIWSRCYGIAVRSTSKAYLLEIEQFVQKTWKSSDNHVIWYPIVFKQATLLFSSRNGISTIHIHIISYSKTENIYLSINQRSPIWTASATAQCVHAFLLLVDLGLHF